MGCKSLVDLTLTLQSFVQFDLIATRRAAGKRTFDLFLQYFIPPRHLIAQP